MQDFCNENRGRLIKTLGQIIKRHRQQNKKTVYSISAEVSMSKSTWREAEIGACKNITLITLWKIAEGLDISPAVLLNELQQELGADFSLTDLN